MWSYLVAFFFRKAFRNLRSNGTFGLIATKTIAQGDTRASGLAIVCAEGGTIFSATKRLRWPGQAAVVVSVVHVVKGKHSGQILRNGIVVERLTSYLFSTGGDDPPSRLTQPIAGVTKGVVPYSVGFVIDDGTEGCLTHSEIDEVLKKEPKSSSLVSAYIGGEEFNSSPELRSTKRIVNFRDMEENEAESYPRLLELIRRTVKPDRDRLTNQSGADNLKRYWWRYQYSAKQLYDALGDLPRVLAIARVTRHVAFGFLPTGMTYNEKLVVFPIDSMSFFTVLQSRVHDHWVWFFSSTMKDDLNYSPTDCFATFPLPQQFCSSARMEAIGDECYDFRASLMVRNNEGLTKTYNRFHDPNETSPEIKKLRELHSAMDQAVLDAYGWTDLKPTCEFVLDYEDDDDEDGDGDTGGGRRRKKPWRYRWPDEFRDEVLARLLELNKQRAEQEQLGGADNESKPMKPARGKKKNEPKTGDLFK